MKAFLHGLLGYSHGSLNFLSCEKLPYWDFYFIHIYYISVDLKIIWNMIKKNMNYIREDAKQKSMIISSKNSRAASYRENGFSKVKDSFICKLKQGLCLHILRNGYTILSLLAEISVLDIGFINQFMRHKNRYIFFSFLRFVETD